MKKKFINIEDKIFISGATGMAGQAIKKSLINSQVLLTIMINS